MFDPAVYLDGYGIRPAVETPGRPPIYRLRSLTGRPLLATSPFLTDSPFPETADAATLDHIERGVEQCRRIGAEYLLIKTRVARLATALGGRFHIDRHYTTHLLPLAVDEESLWHALSATVRNQTRKGYRHHPEVRWGREELLGDFHALFAISQTDLGTPVHGRRYFEAILAHHPSARFVVLYLEGAPACGALTLHDGKTIHHPYAGVVRRFRPTSVNNVLYWEIIKEGLRLGCRRFDMGRSRAGSGNQRYKAAWGGTELPLHYAYWIDGGGAPPDLDAPIYRLLTSAWRHLPLPLATRLGPRLIRSVP